MLSKLHKSKKDQGFTIIEVLIVLAIAGLILLVVFLAVPALQRNSRNTQRKDDVARIGSAVQEYLNNNNGNITGMNSGGIQGLLGTLAYYGTTDVTVAGAANNNVANDTGVDNVKVYTGAKCAPLGGNQSGMGATSANASSRQIAIVYSSETSGGSAKLCTDS